MTLILWTTATMLMGAPAIPADPPAIDGRSLPSAVRANETVATGVQSTGKPVASDTVPPPATSDPTQPEPVAPPQTTESSAAQRDIIVTARDPASAPDPLHAMNLQSFKATQAVDTALIGPVSLAYKHTVPSPLRSGVHNFLYNLREPVVLVNFIFQHKIGKAAETVGRFVVNSTIGIAGVFDVAKKRPFKLPRRGNGFADTLGFYGVPSGPFMFLPIVGPTTVRDLFGGFADRLVLPLIVGSKRLTNPAYAVPAAVLGVLDHRAEFDETLHTLHDNVPDPYANSRAFYLQRRQAEIDHLRGRDTNISSPMSEAPTGRIRLKSKSVPAGTAPVVSTPTVPQH